MLSDEGLLEASSVEEADVVVLNTCCIRENADNKLYGTLGHLSSQKQANPELRIVVAGCLAQKDREALAVRAPYVDVVVGTFNLGRIPALLAQSDGVSSAVEILDQPVAEDPYQSALSVKRESPFSAWVTIQTGCDNRCSFCIVPSVRGVEASRGFGDILDEVKALARSGVSEVTLLGQNVNSYGRDLTLQARRGELSGARAERALSPQYQSESGARVRPLFADLLREVGAVRGIERVRFTSPHPKDMRRETFAAMAETDAVCEQLHFPLQSGSDRILARMHRGYTAERYLERLSLARAEIADLAVSTDIIVGHPGETEEDFEATLQVAAAAEFDSAFTFVFSPRPGTEAALLASEFVDPAVVSERFDRLKLVLERSALARHQARLGKVEEVLVEGPSKRDAARFSGRTRQNKLVHFDAPSDALRYSIGDTVEVLVTHGAPHFLLGEVRGVRSSQRRSRRLVINVA
jgi:tRNA-2-methylthio-N6-dimethylallyladenosine synthase